eukprot:9425814-Prorocentrum_lima.AAC.1
MVAALRSLAVSRTRPPARKWRTNLPRCSAAATSKETVSHRSCDLVLVWCVVRMFKMWTS